MYCVTRMKRVTDPLDDNARARIVGRVRVEPGYASSGSEHIGDDVISPSFSELFPGFGSGGDDRKLPSENYDSDSERDQLMYDSSLRNVDLIKPIMLDCTDEFQNVLRGQVLEATEVFSCVKLDKHVLRRKTMAFLRDRGNNAAVCKTKWGSSGGITAGNHEFIDVVSEDSSTRYFVDLDFAAEFEIARATTSYERLLQQLPRVFVGKIEELKPILRAMSDAAKRSLKSRGLSVPPWRRHRFMQNKWLGSYRRTTNVLPVSFSSAPPLVNQNYDVVKCCTVGFDAAIDGSRLLVPAAARTR